MACNHEGHGDHEGTSSGSERSDQTKPPRKVRPARRATKGRKKGRPGWRCKGLNEASTIAASSCPSCHPRSKDARGLNPEHASAPAPGDTFHPPYAAACKRRATFGSPLQPDGWAPDGALKIFLHRVRPFPGLLRLVKVNGFDHPDDWIAFSTLTPCPMIKLFAILLVTLSLIAPALSAPFTYQGRLQQAGQPANGSYDLRVGLGAFLNQRPHRAVDYTPRWAVSV